MSDPRVSYTCAYCGSSNITRSAEVSWNEELQQFEIECVGDVAYCYSEQCDGHKRGYVIVTNEVVA